MKIGFDAKRALLNHSGLGNYSRNLIEGLLDCYPEHSYHLYSPNENLTYSKELDQHSNENLIYHYPTSYFQKKMTSYWRRNLISAEIKASKIDVYHGLSHELPIGIEKSGARSIVTIHDLIFERYPSYYPMIDRFFYRNKIKHACRVADQIVAISNQTKSDLVDFYKINSKKIQVIYQGCDSSYSKMDRDDSLVKNLNLPEKFILCVGTFSKRKNHLIVLKAFLNIKSEVNEKVVFVGKGGDNLSEINCYIEQNNLKDDIVFLTDCSNEQLRQIYLRASLLVYPSEFEGFGIPILEAFSSNIPVLTNNKDVFREAGGEAAVYVDISNQRAFSIQMKSILENELLRRKCIENGTQQLELFSKDKIAKGYMNLYKKWC